MLIKKENKGSKSGVNTKVLQQSITKKGGGGKDRKSTKPSNLPELSTFGAKRITNKSSKHTKVSRTSTIFGVPLTESTPSVRPAYGGADHAPASDATSSKGASKATASSGASGATASSGASGEDITIDNIHKSSTSFIDNLNIHIPGDIFYNGFIINMNQTEYDKIILEYLQLQRTNPTLIPLTLTTNNDYFKTIITNFKNNIKDNSNSSFSITYFDTLKELFKYELKYRFSNKSNDHLPNLIKTKMSKNDLFNTINQHSIGAQASTSWLRIISIYLNELVNTTYNPNFITTLKEYNDIKKHLIYFELYFILKNILGKFFSIDIINKIFSNIVKHTEENVNKIRTPDYLNKYLKNIGLKDYILDTFTKIVIDDTYQHQFIYILKDVIYMVSSFFKILDFFKQTTLNLAILDQIQLFDTLNIIGVIKQNFLKYLKLKIKSNLTPNEIQDIEWAISNKIPHSFFINYIKTKFDNPDYTPIFFTKHKSIDNSEETKRREEEIIVPGGIEMRETYTYIWSDSKDKETNELDDYALVFVFIFYLMIKGLEEKTYNIKIISEDTNFLGIGRNSNFGNFQNFYDSRFSEKLNTREINNDIYIYIENNEKIKKIVQKKNNYYNDYGTRWHGDRAPTNNEGGTFKFTMPVRNTGKTPAYVPPHKRRGGTRKNIKQLKKFTNKLSRKYKSYNTNKNKNSKKTF